jgi:hypothetical protein
MSEDAAHEWTVARACMLSFFRSFSGSLSSTPMTHTPEVVEEGQAGEVGKAFVFERAFLLVTGHRVAVEG